MDDEAKGETAPQGGLATRWVELIVALLICLGGAIVITDSMRIGAKWESDGPQAGYFPFITGTSLVLAGSWIALQVLLRWKQLAGSMFVEWSKVKPVLSILLPTIVYVALIRLIGIYVASALFIGAFMVWKGRYGWLPTLSISAGVSIALFLLFEVWFLVSLPKGPLEHWLGY